MSLILFLGSGAFSDVFKVRRKSDDQEYALKKVKIIFFSFNNSHN